MAFGRETTDTLVKPLEGAIVRRFTAGVAIEAGEWVVMQSDGAVDPGVATGVQFPLGIAIQDAAAAARVDVVVFGPVLCLREATVGGIIYGSDTAGEPSATAGTKTVILGVAETATILFVNAQVVSLS